MSIIENKFLILVIAIFFATIISSAQSFEGIIVIKEISKQRVGWQDSELVQDEIEQLDREIKELENKIKKLSKTKQQQVAQELESLREFRASFTTSVEGVVSKKTVYINPGRIRIDYKNQDYTTILQLEKGIAWNIYPKEKSYVQSDFSEFIQFSNLLDNVKSLVQTGVTTEINGYPCKQVLWIHKKDTSEFWLTNMLNWKSIYADSLALFIHFDNNEVARAVLPELKKNGSFPIKSVLRTAYNEDIVEVLRIENKHLSTTVFEVPPNFKNLTLEDVLKDDW